MRQQVVNPSCRTFHSEVSFLRLCRASWARKQEFQACRAVGEEIHLFGARVCKQNMSGAHSCFLLGFSSAETQVRQEPASQNRQHAVLYLRLPHVAFEKGCGKAIRSQRGQKRDARPRVESNVGSVACVQSHHVADRQSTFQNRLQG